MINSKQMKLFFLLLFISLIFLSKNSFTQDSLLYQTFLEGKVQLKVPGSFRELSQPEIQKKYLSLEYYPSVELADSGGQTSIKIIVTADKVNDKEVGRYKGWRVSRMLKDTTLRVISHDYIQINHKKVGIIKVIYPSLENYSHYFFTSFDGRLLLVIVECLEPQKSHWEKTFDKIMNSLIIR
ncbi:MAG: hypothetical protein JWM28_3461 [Chitinophagaceae bacterium]|nr:hypothetical protein [Chitinophagaceae bacterium]